MYGQYPGMGPFMMAPQPQQPQVVYVPVSTGPQMPSPPPMMPRKPMKKGMSFKKLLKIKAEVEKALKEAEPKKEDNKPKKLKDKTFNWIELWAMLITWSLPVSLLVLGGVKSFTVLVKSLM